MPGLRPARTRVRADPRKLCLSCPAKRSVPFEELVVTEIVEPVPPRQVVSMIPSVLDGLLWRERRYLGSLRG